MSLLTGEYFEVDAENGFYSHCNGLPDYGLGAPPQKHAMRRFFLGGGNWEVDVDCGSAGWLGGGEGARVRGVLGDLIERSGRVDFTRFGEEEDGDVVMR